MHLYVARLRYAAGLKLPMLIATIMMGLYDRYSLFGNHDCVLLYMLEKTTTGNHLDNDVHIEISVMLML